jgi:hypothetical protein
MDVVTLPIPQLGNRCHVVHDRGLGLVVDPPRDHTIVEQAAAEAGVEIVAVADTPTRVPEVPLRVIGAQAA